MNDELKLVCAKCGACAAHPEDRINGKCQHCGAIQMEILNKAEVAARDKAREGKEDK